MVNCGASTIMSHILITECQCYGHSEECYYDANALGVSVDVEGQIRGGAVCVDCKGNHSLSVTRQREREIDKSLAISLINSYATDNTTGLNCEKCKEGYFRADRESKYSKNCQPCNCNTANIEFIQGTLYSRYKLC